MVQDMEISDYANVPDHRGLNPKETTCERRLFLIGMLTLGILSITQVALNISLRLASNQKEDVDQFPLDAEELAKRCLSDQTLYNSSQTLSCYDNLLRMLLREYQALRAERYILQELLNGQTDYSSADFEFVGDQPSDDLFDVS